MEKIKTFARFVGGIGTLIGIGFLVGVSVGYTHSAAAEIVYKEKAADVRQFPAALQVICKAESTGKQFKPDGHVIRGHITPSDIGICQINEPIWNDKARDLGFDIYTEEGNKAMALWLFDHLGSEPWNSSKSAWLPKLKGTVK